MGEAEKRLHRCCFTGHRPEKLLRDKNSVCTELRLEIERAINNEFSTFITGMARGVDIWAAEQVLQCRNRYPHIHLICALPHPNFEKRWHDSWQKKYHAILEEADFIKMICPAYSFDSYQRRNEWMINHSARLICVFNGTPGGTQNTIRYAEKVGIEVVYISEGDQLDR